MTEPNRLHYSRREAARALGLSLRTVDNLLASNRLGSEYVKARRLIHRDHLIAFGGRAIELKLDYF